MMTAVRLLRLLKALVLVLSLLMTANARTQPRRAEDVIRDSGTECAIRRWLQ